MHQTRRTLLALALGVAVVGGCKKKDAPVGDSSTVTTTPAFRVTDVDLGRSIGADKHVSDKTDHFGRTDTIYASVTSEGSAPSKALSARWTFEDGQVVDDQSQTITPSGSATTEFHITKPTAWPVGKYKVEILVDGVSVQTKDFEVK